MRAQFFLMTMGCALLGLVGCEQTALNNNPIIILSDQILSEPSDAGQGLGTPPLLGADAGQSLMTDASVASMLAAGPYDVGLGRMDSGITDAGLNDEIAAFDAGVLGFDAGIQVGCGDGEMVYTEECDDGAGLNSDSLPDVCRTNCMLPFCGDGIVDAGESCDDGNLFGGDG